MSEAAEQPDLLAPAADAAPEREPTIYELLRARHAPPEWAFMEEVAPATGGGTRYADAVAVNLWSSRGHEVVGYEVKVSRSDWLRELKQPEKAEPVMRYCDRWFVVTEKDCIKPGELPVNWGHMERRGSRLVQVAPAPRLEPKALTREFFASLMRRGHEQIEKIASNTFASRLAARLAEIDADAERRIEHRTREQRREVEETRAQIEKLEAATGLKISRWAGPPIATIKLAVALERLNEYGNPGALAHLVNLADQLDRAAGAVRKAVADTQLDAGPASDPITGTGA